jgi:hypothetical protein
VSLKIPAVEGNRVAWRRLTVASGVGGGVSNDRLRIERSVLDIMLNIAAIEATALWSS